MRLPAEPELVRDAGTDRVVRRLVGHARHHFLLLELAEAILQPCRPAAGHRRLDARSDREAAEARVALGERRHAAQRSAGRCAHIELAVTARCIEQRRRHRQPAKAAHDAPLPVLLGRGVGAAARRREVDAAGDALERVVGHHADQRLRRELPVAAGEEAAEKTLAAAVEAGRGRAGEGVGLGEAHAAADRAAEIDAGPVEGLRAAGERLVGRHHAQAAEAIAEAGTDRVRRRFHRNAGAADGLASELAVAILELGRQVVGQHGLEARTEGPAVHRVVGREAGGSARHRRGAVGVDDLPGIAAREVEQRRGIGEEAGAQQHGPAEAGVLIDLSEGARDARRDRAVETRIARLGHQADEPALGDLIVDAAIDRAEDAALAAAVDIGVQGRTTDVESVESAAGAKRGADIKTGPYRTEVFGGNGNRGCLSTNRKRHSGQGGRNAKEWADFTHGYLQNITPQVRLIAIEERQPVQSTRERVTCALLAIDRCKFARHSRHRTASAAVWRTANTRHPLRQRTDRDGSRAACLAEAARQPAGSLRHGYRLDRHRRRRRAFHARTERHRRRSRTADLQFERPHPERRALHHRGRDPA